MKEILDFYQQQAKSRVSSIPWLAQLQSKALADLGHRGFPTRHDEDWKYTLIDSFLKQLFTSVNSAQENTPKQHLDIPVPHQLIMRHGILSGYKELMEHLASGILILPLTEALTHYPELTKPYLGTILQQEHGFHFLNTAMIHSGFFIYIPEGISLPEPICVTHVQDEKDEAVYLRNLIIAQDNSQVSVIEAFYAQTEETYLTNTVTECFLNKNASLTHYKIQKESKQAFHLGHLSVKQAAHSHFASHSISLGGQLVRSDLTVALEEEYAHCLMNGIYAPNLGQHVDHHTTVHHLVPHCTSEQDYKGILAGASRAVFNGKVIVAKNAQKTNAKQQNKNLLLSAHAEIDTKPQLEIFADDVLCSHGATVGQLDEDAVFYLATRGIGRAQASQFLIHAFAQVNLQLISEPQLAHWIGNLLTEQLGLCDEYAQ